MADRRTVPDTSFVGRNNELEWLDHRTAAGGVTVIEGPAGIGKSRLVAAHVADRRSAWGRAWQSETSALLPWRQLASALAPMLDPSAIPLTFGHVLGATFAHLPTPETTQIDVLAIAWREYLGQLAATGPVTLVLEDVHRADAESLQLLSSLAAPDLPCPLILTTRPIAEIESDAIGSTLGATARAADVLTLAGLSPPDAIRLIRSLVPDAPAVEAAVELADGVPLHLVELATTLRSGGSPSALPDLVEQRLAGLPPRARRAMEAASILAEDEIDPTAVGAMVGVSTLDAVDLLGHAMRAGFVTGPTPMRIAHDVYRDAVVGRADARTRAELHAAAWSFLCQTPGSTTHDQTRRADHALAGRPIVDGDAAGESVIDLARTLLAEGAFDTANRYLRSALRGATTPQVRTALSLLLGRVRLLLHRDDAHDILDGLLAQALENADSDALAAVGRASIPAAWPHALDAEPDMRTINRLRTVRAALADDDATRGPIAGALAISDFTAQGVHDVDAWVAEAQAAAAEAGDSRLAAWALIGAVGARRVPGAGPADLDLVDDHLRTLGDDFSDEHLSLLALRISLLWRIGRFDDVKETMGRLDGFGPSVPGLLHWARLRWRATLAVVEGRYPVAERLLTEAFDAGVAAGRSTDAERFFGVQAAMVARDRYLDVGDLVADWERSHAGSVLVQCLGAWGLADHGHERAALGMVTSAAEPLLAAPEVAQHHTALMAAMFVAGWAGDAPLSRRLLDTSRPYWDEWAVLGSGLIVMGPVALCAGVAASGAGDDDLAVDLLTRARALAATASPPGAAHAALELARHHRRCRRDEAAGWFDIASQEFAALGLGTRAERAHRAATDPNDSGRGPLPPTPATLGSTAPATTPLATLDGDRDASVIRAGLRRDGSTWTAWFDAGETHLPHRKGLIVVAALIEHADTAISCLDLAALIDGGTAPLQARHDVIDRHGLASLREHARTLAEDSALAGQRGDEATVTRIRAELEMIEETVQRATRPGGGTRSFTDDGERARTRIAKLIRSALDAVDGDLPAMADHLQRSLSTGHSCMYRTASWHRVEWSISH